MSAGHYISCTDSHPVTQHGSKQPTDSLVVSRLPPIESRYLPIQHINQTKPFELTCSIPAAVTPPPPPGTPCIGGAAGRLGRTARHRAAQRAPERQEYGEEWDGWSVCGGMQKKLTAWAATPAHHAAGQRFLEGLSHTHSRQPWYLIDSIPDECRSSSPCSRAASHRRMARSPTPPAAGAALHAAGR